MHSPAVFCFIACIFCYAQSALAQDSERLLEEMRRCPANEADLRISWDLQVFVGATNFENPPAPGSDPFGVPTTALKDFSANASGNELLLRKNDRRIRFFETTVVHRKKEAEQKLLLHNMALVGGVATTRMEQFAQGSVTPGKDSLDLYDPGIQAMLLNYRSTKNDVYSDLVDKKSKVIAADALWAGRTAIAVDEGPRKRTLYFDAGAGYRFLGFERKSERRNEVHQLEVYFDKDTETGLSPIRRIEYRLRDVEDKLLRENLYENISTTLVDHISDVDLHIDFPVGYLVFRPRDGGKKHLSWVVNENKELELLTDANRDKLHPRVSRPGD
ncbi:MAG: hypothetical protein ACE361_11355 [Aureliella sp.]